MNNENKTTDTFTYSYSAPTPEQKRQAKTILAQYEVKNDNLTTLDELKAIDRRARLYPKLFAYIFGTVFTLVFGIGLTMLLEWSAFIHWSAGVILCAVGAIGCFINYPIYNLTLKKNKQKYSEIIKVLANEILNQSND